MRDYAIVRPSFWIGTTGRAIRAAGRDALLIALYLITGPNADMLGLYYLPLATLAHEVGVSQRRSRQVLAQLSELGFAYYDPNSEYVWVPEMARFQIGETLQASDKRVVGIAKRLRGLKGVSFVGDFLRKYREPFHLDEVEDVETLARNIEGPPKDPRSQDQDQKQEQEQDQDQHQEQEQEPGSGSARMKRGKANDPGARFEQFWESYPRKVSRKAAEAVWSKLKPDDSLTDTILTAVRKQASSPAWQRDGGQFIPYPTTWLNGRRWEDETIIAGGHHGTAEGPLNVRVVEDPNAERAKWDAEHQRGVARRARRCPGDDAQPDTGTPDSRQD